MTLKSLPVLSLLFLSICMFADIAYTHQKAVVIPLSSSKPVVGDFVGGNQNLWLTAADKIIRSLTLDVPGNGIVIVNVSGVFAWAFTTDKTSSARCSITQGNTIDFDYLIISGGDANNTMGAEYLSFAGTRAFPVDKATQTFNLVCDSYDINDNQIVISDTSMNAIYYNIPD